MNGVQANINCSPQYPPMQAATQGVVSEPEYLVCGGFRAANPRYKKPPVRSVQAILEDWADSGDIDELADSLRLEMVSFKKMALITNIGFRPIDNRQLTNQVLMLTVMYKHQDDFPVGLAETLMQHPMWALGARI